MPANATTSTPRCLSYRSACKQTASMLRDLYGPKPSHPRPCSSTPRLDDVCAGLQGGTLVPPSDLLAPLWTARPAVSLRAVYLWCAAELLEADARRMRLEAHALASEALRRERGLRHDAAAGRLPEAPGLLDGTPDNPEGGLNLALAAASRAHVRMRAARKRDARA